jgi:hypothetical protein
MSHTAAPTLAAPAPPAPQPAYPSDEQILGIVPEGGDESAFDALLASAAANARQIIDARANGNAAPRDVSSGASIEDDVILSGGRFGRSEESVSPATNRATSAISAFGSFVAQNAPQDDNALAGAARSNAKAPQNTTAPAPLPTDAPDWLARASAAAPESAPQLATLWQRATVLDTFDRAYYGADAAAQQTLVAQLFADDPAALRAMVAAAQQFIDGNGNVRHNTRDVILSGGRFGRSEGSVSPGTNRATSATSSMPSDGSFAAQNAPQDDNRFARGADPRHAPQNANAHANRADANANAAPQFDPAAYAQFEQSTNDAVVADVNRAIERALDRALPNNISDGARRRIAGDTLAEVHAALRGDRDLSAQVAQMLRGSGASPTHSQLAAARFDSATRDAVARLIATRARTVVPEAARRVIGEWTGSVLASHRDRAAKTQAANARIDVTGGAINSPTPRRAVAPRDINYRATSDEDILSW